MHSRKLPTDYVYAWQMSFPITKPYAAPLFTAITQSALEFAPIKVFQRNGGGLRLTPWQTSFPKDTKPSPITTNRVVLWSPVLTQLQLMNGEFHEFQWTAAKPCLFSGKGSFEKMKAFHLCKPRGT